MTPCYAVMKFSLPKKLVHYPQWFISSRNTLTDKGSITFPNSVPNWEPNDQIYEPMWRADISHSNQQWSNAYMKFTKNRLKHLKIVFIDIYICHVFQELNRGGQGIERCQLDCVFLIRINKILMSIAHSADCILK